MTAEAYFAKFGAIETKPMTAFQTIVARRLTQSWTAIPHVTHHDDVDVTALEAHRKSADAPKASLLVYLVKALAAALKAFPTFNASLSEDGATLILKQYVHVGIAVDGPLGLLVPVLRDADRKDVASLAAELREVVERARSKGLPMSVMEGGSMTITSLGGIGGTGFTPIVNQPEVAILGVTPSRMTPVWDGTAFQPRLLMPLSLSYDHRVINGADAARFCRHIASSLAAPETL